MPVYIASCGLHESAFIFLVICLLIVVADLPLRKCLSQYCILLISDLLHVGDFLSNVSLWKPLHAKRQTFEKKSPHAIPCINAEHYNELYSFCTPHMTKEIHAGFLRKTMYSYCLQTDRNDVNFEWNEFYSLTATIYIQY